MFPQLRERLGSAFDLFVEFSTLGEYRLGADGAVWPASALALHAPEREPQLGGAGDHPLAAQAAVRRIVAGGAAGIVPVATPAARRLAASRLRSASCHGERAGERPAPPRAGPPGPPRAGPRGLLAPANAPPRRAGGPGAALSGRLTAVIGHEADP